MGVSWRRVTGTGHRELEAGDDAWVAEQLPKAAVWLRDCAGTRVGVSGLALGFDMDWAEAVLDAGMDLWVAIPFEGQAARWSRAQRARWEELRAAAAREHIVGEVPADLPASRRSGAVNRLLFRRNTKMLDVAGAVLTVWEPGRFDGGTAGALLEAAKRSLPGVHLDPVARQVNFELPGRGVLERFTLHHGECGCVAYVGTRTAARERFDALVAAGHASWRVRAARPRETFGDGCDVCAADLVDAANVNAAA